MSVPITFLIGILKMTYLHRYPGDGQWLAYKNSSRYGMSLLLAPGIQVNSHIDRMHNLYEGRIQAWV